MPCRSSTTKNADRILDAAAELFATRPFHKVLLDDVAVEAAVGKGTLYTYFENKESLYLAVIDSSFEKLVDQLQAMRWRRTRRAVPARRWKPWCESSSITASRTRACWTCCGAGPLPQAAFARWSQKSRN